jgi:hypothetical protein
METYQWPIVQYEKIRFRSIPLDWCLEFARELQDEGRKWHSHVLPPGCLVNPYRSFAVVIEDDDAGEAFIACSMVFPEVDRTFVRMLHGEDILIDGASVNSALADVHSSTLDLVRAADEAGFPWHHHMCFPECVFNSDRGKWTITTECNGEMSYESWDEEPVVVLRELEQRFFSEE